VLFGDVDDIEVEELPIYEKIGLVDIPSLKVSTASTGEYPFFKPYRELDSLINLGVTSCLQTFCGTICYDTLRRKRRSPGRDRSY